MSAPSKSILKRSVDELRAALVTAGRDAADALIYGQMLIITAATEAAAQAKHAEYLEHINMDAALVLLSGWTGVDFSQIDPDATIEYIENDAGRTALASFSKADPNRKWTVREAAKFIGLGGRGPVVVGSPMQVADQLEAWIDESGIDGFNLAFAVMPETFSDVVELIVPELQKRGRYPSSYAAGTLREKLFSRSAFLRENHAARRIRIAAN